MMILGLWAISFHAMVVFGLGKNLLSKSILGLFVVVYTLVVSILWPFNNTIKKIPTFKSITQSKTYESMNFLEKFW